MPNAALMSRRLAVITCMLLAVALGVAMAAANSKKSSSDKLVRAPKLSPTGAIELRADNIESQVLENGVWFVRLYVHHAHHRPDM
jgi:hypothetical protein